MTAAWKVVLGAVLAGVLATITGWTTGGINAGWNWLTSDASPVQVAVPRPIPDSPQPAGSTGSPSAAKAPATGNGVGSPSPRPDGRLSIANANFEVSEVLGQGGCQLQAAVPRHVSRIRPPRIDGDRPDLAQWVKDNDAADPDVTRYLFTVSAKPGRTVTLTRAHTVFVKRTARPAQGAVVNLFIGNSCGAGGAFRHFVNDLDDPTGAWAPRNDDKYQVHEKTNFPYVVKNDDPETFVLTATTVNCDCTWRIQLDWTSDTETGHTIIDNAVGRNFRTMGTDGYPQIEWWHDYSTHTWVTKRPTTSPW